MAPQLIISADDFGLTPGVNRAVQELAELGSITATNVMVNMPHADHIFFLATGHPQLSIGVHVNLTQGEPILSPEQIPTLVNADGTFYSRKELVKRAVHGRISYEECVREIEAQVTRAFELTGSHIDHWNSHEGVHRFEPIASAAITVCRNARIKGMRTHRHRFLGASRDRFPSLSQVIRLLKEVYYLWLFWRARRDFSLPDAVLARPEATALEVMRWITQNPLPEGVWELVCHPATTPHGLFGTTMVETRVCEYRYLISKEFRSAVTGAHISLIGFTELYAQSVSGKGYNGLKTDQNDGTNELTPKVKTKIGPK